LYLRTKKTQEKRLIIKKRGFTPLSQQKRRRGQLKGVLATSKKGRGRKGGTVSTFLSARKGGEGGHDWFGKRGEKKGSVSLN